MCHLMKRFLSKVSEMDLTFLFLWILLPSGGYILLKPNQKAGQIKKPQRAQCTAQPGKAFQGRTALT